MTHSEIFTPVKLQYVSLSTPPQYTTLPISDQDKKYMIENNFVLVKKRVTQSTIQVFQNVSSLFLAAYLACPNKNEGKLQLFAMGPPGPGHPSRQVY